MWKRRTQPDRLQEREGAWRTSCLPFPFPPPRHPQPRSYTVIQLRHRKGLSTGYSAIYQFKVSEQSIIFLNYSADQSPSRRVVYQTNSRMKINYEKKTLCSHPPLLFILCLLSLLAAASTHVYACGRRCIRSKEEMQVNDSGRILRASFPHFPWSLTVIEQRLLQPLPPLLGAPFFPSLSLHAAVNLLASPFPIPREHLRLLSIRFCGTLVARPEQVIIISVNLFAINFLFVIFSWVSGGDSIVRRLDLC